MKKLIFIILIGIVSCKSRDKKPEIPNNVIPSEQQLISVVEQHPDSLLAVESLIQFYRDEDNYDSAIAVTNRAINRDSSLPRLWDIKAILHLENADTINAIRSLEKAVSLFPNPDNLQSLGILYAQTKNKLSLAVADTILSRFNRSSEKEAVFIKGLYYSYNNEKVKAIKYFDECLVISFTYIDAYREKAIALYDLGRYEDALAVLDKSLILQSGYEEGHYYRGQCLEKLNRIPDAIEAYKTALMFDPDYGDAKEALRKLEPGK